MPRTDTASRVIAAPRAQVYAALVDREALLAWLPPDGMTARFERFDPRPGGSYRPVLTYADPARAAGKATADSDIVEARYLDIVPDIRVVQAVDFISDDPVFAGTMTMTWEVTAVDGGARVEIIASGWSRTCLIRSAHDVELHAIDEGVVVDGARVCSPPAEALQIRLSGLSKILVGDRGERDEVDVVDLDRDLSAAVDAADLDLRSRPQPVGDGDGPVGDPIAKLRAELHATILS